ncbi:hypothetical protein EVAR_45037_1 [Eumeta japonica]|uniref:Uncharacterized protein n=1 Tax=Eumeta variegata TaxID=151549 RepID=A0A4C1YRA5_EUMVA|nr:hypothetical protein EVAR_45037_1 [Eumeta japonica]
MFYYACEDREPRQHTRPYALTHASTYPTRQTHTHASPNTGTTVRWSPVCRKASIELQYHAPNFAAMKFVTKASQWRRIATRRRRRKSMGA